MHRGLGYVEIVTILLADSRVDVNKEAKVRKSILCYDCDIVVLLQQCE